ncbi:hypothetical protein [Aquimarina sp. 2201CG14-23]|uniref:hypothetical protein n=1 Tax=Aquimarina mycalae TaxID=3040073 RepID=UPI0024781ABA|nr:hypothetical protein [Aquimarina sp. 2201CG14-23]MDH7444303.1 hypothetical protein [Aquimarina sp. 2201CG14-23]
MKNLRKYYVLIVALSLVLVSCEKDEVQEPIEGPQAEEIGIEEIEADVESSDMDGKSFVITEDGKQISEEEYLKLTAEKNNSLAKSSNTYSYNISGADMDKLGMRHSDARTVMDRYKRNQAWLNYPNVNIYGLLVGCRPFGNSATCTGDRSAKWHLTRESVGDQFTRRVSGPFILTEREKKGLPNRDVSLGGQRAFDYQESVTGSITVTLKAGLKVGVKASAGFLGTGTEVTGEVNFEASVAGLVGRTVTRTNIINFSDGDFVPKGKKCDFRIIGEKRETVKKYNVKVRVKGPAYVRFTAGGEQRVRDEADGAKYAFPDKERNGGTYSYEVKNQYWRYSIERVNCRNL